MGLTPNDEGEGDEVVENPHAEKRGPETARCRHLEARDLDDQPQNRGGEGDADEDDGEGRQFGYGDAHEKERTAP